MTFKRSTTEYFMAHILAGGTNGSAKDVCNRAEEMSEEFWKREHEKTLEAQKRRKETNAKQA